MSRSNSRSIQVLDFAETIVPTRVVIFDGKWRKEQCIDVSSPERYESVALAIVKLRLDDNYYDPSPEPKQPDMTMHQVTKVLPKGPFRDFGLNLWANYREYLKRYNDEVSFRSLVQECIEQEDGPTAIRILEERTNVEGEQFRILDVCRDI